MTGCCAVASCRASAAARSRGGPSSDGVAGLRCRTQSTGPRGRQLRGGQLRGRQLRGSQRRSTSGARSQTARRSTGHGVIARIVVVTFGAESGDIGDREMGIVLIALYLAVLLLLCGYGLHRARLAWLCLRCQPPHRAKLLPPEQLPTVTVQLP